MRVQAVCMRRPKTYLALMAGEGHQAEDRVNPQFAAMASAVIGAPAGAAIGRVAAPRRVRVPPSCAVKEVFMPALSSTMTEGIWALIAAIGAAVAEAVRRRPAPATPVLLQKRQ